MLNVFWSKDFVVGRLRDLTVGTTIMLFIVSTATAQRLPSSETLDAIFPVLRHKVDPGPPLKSQFSRSVERTEEAACGLTPIDLTQTSGSEKHIFKLLGQPLSETDSQPVSMLVRLSRLTVNADGSRRAYHPEDPFGVGVCKGAAPHKSGGVCALDVLSDAEIHLYRGSERIPQSSCA